MNKLFLVLLFIPLVHGFQVTPHQVFVDELPQTISFVTSDAASLQTNCDGVIDEYSLRISNTSTSTCDVYVDSAVGLETVKVVIEFSDTLLSNQSVAEVVVPYVPNISTPSVYIEEKGAEPSKITGFFAGMSFEAPFNITTLGNIIVVILFVCFAFWLVPKK